MRDFEVYSFANHDIEELEELKEQFIFMCDEEIRGQTQEIDLCNLTKEEFIYKYEDDFDNSENFTDRLHSLISNWEDPDPKYHPVTGEYNWRQLLDDYHNKKDEEEADNE
jgi:hypothetical protein